MRPRLAAALVLACAALAAGCGRGQADREQERVVRRYLELLVEAYRTSDAELMAPLAGEAELRKLTGLIGVKRDAGVYLDAQLVELRLGRARRSGDQMQIETWERWRYRDRRLGTGAQIGEESLDSYALRYHLARENGRWVVQRLEFTEPPQVGRRERPLRLDVRVAHGLPPREGGP